MELSCSNNEKFLIFQGMKTLKNFLYFEKWNFLALIIKNLLYFRKRKPRKNSLYFLKRNIFRKWNFLIFHESIFRILTHLEQEAYSELWYI